MSCSKSKSMLFAAKQRCRSDTTKIRYGPEGFNKLKRAHQDAAAIWMDNGWRKGDPSFILESEFTLNLKDQETEELRKLNKMRYDEDAKKQKRFLDYILSINKFFKEQGKGRLKGLKGTQLLDEIKQYRDDTIQNTEKDHSSTKKSASRRKSRRFEGDILRYKPEERVDQRRRSQFSLPQHLIPMSQDKVKSKTRQSIKKEEAPRRRFSTFKIVTTRLGQHRQFIQQADTFNSLADEISDYIVHVIYILITRSSLIVMTHCL